MTRPHRRTRFGRIAAKAASEPSTVCQGLKKQSGGASPTFLGRQNYLARVLTLFYIGLCLADLCEREAFVHMGADPAIRDALQQYFHPARDHVGLVPHVAEVYAEG